MPSALPHYLFISLVVKGALWERETGTSYTWDFQIGALVATRPHVLRHYRFVGLVVNSSASRAEDPVFESRLRCGDFSGSSHTGDLNTGTPVANLSCLWRDGGQRWDWSALCQYTETGWDGKFELQLLLQCDSTYNCLRRSVPEIH